MLKNEIALSKEPPRNDSQREEYYTIMVFWIWKSV